MINKRAQRKQAQEDFDAIPMRVYAESDLQDFHKKIQRFWSEPREVVLSKGMSGTAQKFDHDALAVAYGAARKVDSGAGKFHYLYSPERYGQLNNLWNQYDAWRKKQDWISNKNAEESAKSAGVPF